MTSHLVPLDAWATWRTIALRSAGFPAAGVSRFAAPESCCFVDRMLDLEANGNTSSIAAARDAAASQLARDRVAINGRVHDLARDERFREALAWQNPVALETLVAPLLASELGKSDAPTRRREATLASYTQRYCVKNDTIGFFGPVGWAELVDDEDTRVTPGPSLLDERRVHFEYWGIDALAGVFAQDPSLRLDLAPRRLPSVRIEDDTVHYGIGSSARIGDEFLAVLAACDGTTSARSIAAKLADRFGEEEVYEMLGELVDQRLIRWTIEIPTAGQFPERHLQAALAALPPSEARDAAESVLASLVAARDDIARAAGDAERLGEAQRALSARFFAITDLAGTRRGGETYAGRTLVYEETRRDVRVTLGRRVQRALAAPLGLVLTTARWYTHEVAKAYLAIADDAHAALRDESGHNCVDYLQFMQRMLPHFAGQDETAPLVRRISDTMQRRWLELLAITPGERRVVRSAEALREPVERAFAAPGPGWPHARYQAPDIMIAARGPAALAAGDFTCVLGEVHTGMQTFTAVFANMHPDPASLVRMRRADLERPLVANVEPRASALRANNISFCPDDLDIEIGDARSWRAPDHVLVASELVVARAGDRLVVHTRDRARTFDLVEVLHNQLVLASATHFHILPSLPHVPRIEIDGLVVAREAWTFAPAALAFAQLNGFDRFAGARRWARHHGLPRRVFVRIPEEPKPLFVDFDSPVYVDILAKLVRKASIVKLSEMLPDLDDTWLVDGDGKTYTAELRMTCVDPIPWRSRP